MKKVVLGCLAAVVVVGIAGTVACWYLVLRETPQLTSTLQLPSEVAAGESLELVVSATNPHSSAVTLDSIDIDDALMRGFQVQGIEPEPSDTMHIPIVNQRSWSFDRSVPPGGDIVVTFRLRSLEPGHYTGNVDVCNPNQDFTTLYADVVVRRAVEVVPE